MDEKIIEHAVRIGYFELGDEGLVQDAMRAAKLELLHKACDFLVKVKNASFRFDEFTTTDWSDDMSMKYIIRMTIQYIS